MTRSVSLLALAVAAAALTACAAQPAAEAPAVVSGRLVAQRFCGACHSTTAAPSALADAPPFRSLHERYGADGLQALLSEGMLAPDRLQEEGGPSGHPRMPTVTLTGGERRDLEAYLRSLEPRP